jgi:hypothetical protein
LITDNLLNLLHDLDFIIVNCFDNKELLKTSKIYALEYVLSLKTNTLAELTSKHIDNKLRKENKVILVFLFIYSYKHFKKKKKVIQNY